MTLQGRPSVASPESIAPDRIKNYDAGEATECLPYRIDLSSTINVDRVLT
jgi:hypothetical protein